MNIIFLYNTTSTFHRDQTMNQAEQNDGYKKTVKENYIFTVGTIHWSEKVNLPGEPQHCSSFDHVLFKKYIDLISLVRQYSIDVEMARAPVATDFDDFYPFH